MPENVGVTADVTVVCDDHTSALHTSIFSDSSSRKTFLPECLQADSMAHTCRIFKLDRPLVSRKKTFLVGENVCRNVSTLDRSNSLTRHDPVLPHSFCDDKRASFC